MTLYERNARDLESQILHWETVRKQYVTMYYARKEGFRSLGMQPLPALTVSEYKAKEGIQMVLLLRSLQKSEFATEDWTLIDTSAELLHTPPKNCFKKGGYTVEVYFDENPDNVFPYTNWDFIYYQDTNEKWHKTAGLVDYDGMYFQEPNGDRTYFQLFEKDALRYGSTGRWSVQYKNQTILPSASVSSSTRRSVDEPDEARSGPSTYPSTPPQISSRRSETEERGLVSSTLQTPPQTSGEVRLRRRRGKGERTTRKSPTKRRRTDETDSPGLESVPSPEAVGTRHRTVPSTGLSRLRRLQIEARDPPAIIVTGPANSLKCWRWRLKKYSRYYARMSTVWSWAGEVCPKASKNRMLIAFTDETQRSVFLKLVSLPKHTTYGLAQLGIL